MHQKACSISWDGLLLSICTEKNTTLKRLLQIYGPLNYLSNSFKSQSHFILFISKCAGICLGSTGKKLNYNMSSNNRDMGHILILIVRASASKD